MEFKGIKEQWFIENLNEPRSGKYPAKEIVISTENHESICTIWHSEIFDEESKANALLISKAPEMLKKLNELLSCISEDTILHDTTIKQWFQMEAKKLEILIKEATEIKSESNE
jgi:hypothetical protein